VKHLAFLDTPSCLGTCSSSCGCEWISIPEDDKRFNSGQFCLASSSTYRRQLLQRLGLAFSIQAPEVDETPRPTENAEHLASRLAQQKAEHIAHEALANPLMSETIVIGSDQVAACGSMLLGKPGTPEAAVQQLTAMAGQRVTFYTGLHLCTATQHVSHVDQTTVVVRDLSTPEIERYVSSEPALDCAGSFKVEGLGITLFSAIETRDPTALMGLPLIATCNGLRQLGLALP